MERPRCFLLGSNTFFLSRFTQHSDFGLVTSFSKGWKRIKHSLSWKSAGEQSKVSSSVGTVGHHAEGAIGECVGLLPSRLKSEPVIVLIGRKVQKSDQDNGNKSKNKRFLDII